MIGLLEPTKGKIFIDDIDLYDPKFPKKIYSWRLGISNVPQDIYLLDQSFKENIALGVPFEKIDKNQLEIAANNAKIKDFILKTKKGFETKVGERGSNLSGGQRQRIAIARAFYKNSKWLKIFLKK